MTLPKPFLDIPIAHRALHGPGAPENSAEAVRRAVASGYGIEIDLQPSADEVAMVFHDPTLDRMTSEDGAVRGRSAADLGTIALVGGDEGIPSLAEVLDLVGGAVPLLIEMKDQSGGKGGTDGVLEAATARALDGYDGPAAVMSFNPAMVAEMARLTPNLPRGLTTGSFHGNWTKGLPEDRVAHLRDIGDFDSVSASFISHDRRHLDAGAVTRLKGRGVPVLTWTIRSPEEEAAARMVADNVTFEGYLA